uniref:CXXC-type zinc finger protein 1 n=1 Tax=Myxobolus squamalis TaxID=59785 RepID=A0A6B2G3M7_MYXSQ
METEDEVSDATVFCFTCGLPFSYKTSMRHMEKCFKKAENSISYGSSYPSTSSIYCDFYDATEKNYCKRLKAVCFEHYKTEKSLPNEICGCPLKFWATNHQIDLSSNDICKDLISQCNKHFGWQQLKHASLEHQKHYLTKKIEDLVNTENSLITEKKNRWNLENFIKNNSTKHDGD